MKQSDLLPLLEFKLQASNLAKTSEHQWSGLNLLASMNATGRRRTTFETQEDEPILSKSDTGSTFGTQDNRERHFRAPSTGEAAATSVQVSRSTDLIESDVFVTNIADNSRRGSISSYRPSHKSTSRTTVEGLSEQQRQYEINITLAALLGTAVLSTLTFILIVLVLCGRGPRRTGSSRVREPERVHEARHESRRQSTTTDTEPTFGFSHPDCSLMQQPADQEREIQLRNLGQAPNPEINTGLFVDCSTGFFSLASCSDRLAGNMSKIGPEIWLPI